ncbi:fungal specific transcription factor [Aspergillus bombycis]|uniref:Fungal specific transcription factor n=1 Tax=Aspergillus bombycis TaxID=109264 RepID=A0A1F8ACN1_9EURO|nr:fungal specific transcription factor [Aspergillus bombycis]OGM49494.1 fungal specific transcription factor [Aspergillus bombycis]
MFEDFLGQAGHENLCKAKLVLFGEPSPLTFALQLRRDMNSGLHDANQRILSSDSLTVVEENVHPKHLLPHDIECLKAKGAFIYPEAEILGEMINVFLDRFYPLYSVVNPTDLRKAQEERKLPWILLHSVCFIAMTFCESAMIYQAGFSCRAQARRLYYDRAKALFDFNYENNKIILVKVAILLSFKGPQMDCYWNPCSWIEIGVTMAVALGMHRKSIAMNGKSNDRGLLRRLWWTLAVRDAHCSALLGRPFRINMAQCDIEMLKENDFPDEHTCRSPTTPLSCNCRQSFEYQIQATKLSLFLRDIMHFRFGPTSVSSTIGIIHEQLMGWKAQLPTAMQFLRGQSSVSTWAVQLDILLNYHIMLLHMDQPRQSRPNPSSLSTAVPGGYDSTAIAESSALAVSSSAIKLITRDSICNTPHEVFPGFFMAGIILYQQAQQAQNTHLARMIRASFDNCQMLLTQAQNTWDPGIWAMKVFEFLLLAADAVDAAEAQIPSAIVAALLDSGAPVKVLYRPGSDISSLPDSVAKTVVDLDNPDATVAALQDVDIVISLVGHEGVTRQLALVNAIPKTNVRLFVPSDLAARYDEQGLRIPVNHAKDGIERAARAAGIPVTVVLTGNFAEFALATPAMGVDRRNNRIIFTGESEHKALNLCTKPYVAAAYASLFASTSIDQLKDRTIGLCEIRATGSEIAHMLTEQHGSRTCRKHESMESIGELIETSLATGSNFALAFYCRKIWGSGQQTQMMGDDFWDVKVYQKASLHDLIVGDRLQEYRLLPPAVLESFESHFEQGV